MPSPREPRLDRCNSPIVVFPRLPMILTGWFGVFISMATRSSIPPEELDLREKERKTPRRRSRDWNFFIDENDYRSVVSRKHGPRSRVSYSGDRRDKMAF